MMSASFPTSLKTFTTKQDRVNVVEAGDVDDLQDEMAAVQAVLGAGVGTKANTVRAQLSALISEIVALQAQAVTDEANLANAALVPVGVVLPFAGVSPPSGYLLCDGRVYNDSDYPSLQASIGYAYGGDGNSTFAVPDMRGRFPIGAGSRPGGFNTNVRRGATGNDTHTHPIPGHSLSGSETGSHSHGVNDPGHIHQFADNGHNHGLSDPGHAHNVFDPGHLHQITVGATGGSTAGIHFGSGGGAGAGGGAVGIAETQSDATGVAIYGAGTGQSIGVGASGVTDHGGNPGRVDGSGTGISIQGTNQANAHTHPDTQSTTVHGADGYTGDSPRPPYIGLNYIIKT